MAVDPKFLNPPLQVGAPGAGIIVFQGASVGGDDLVLKTHGLTTLDLLDVNTTLTAPTGCRVHHTAVQAIANGTTTNLVFNTDLWDTEAIHSPSVDPDRLTVQTTGYYYVFGSINWEIHATAATTRQLSIWMPATGTIALTQGQTIASASGFFAQNISTVAFIGAGSWFELRVWQNSGTTLDVLSAANYTPAFGMHRIS